MGHKSTRAFLVAMGIAVGASLTMLGTPAALAATVVTDPGTGNVTVTLADSSDVLVSATLATQIVAAVKSGDAAAVTDAIKALVQEYAANDTKLATAIYVLALSSTSDPALEAAAYAGVVAGNPAAATQVADNSPGTPGAPGGKGSGSGPSGNGNFPNGGTSGGGSTPSPSGP